MIMEKNILKIKLKKTTITPPHLNNSTLIWYPTGQLDDIYSLEPPVRACSCGDLPKNLTATLGAGWRLTFCYLHSP